jgi:hypothetical protein
MVANCASQEAGHSETEQPQPKRKRIRLKTARRREQCRANQARYRQKQMDHAKTLEESVQQLHSDIPVLELQRNRLLYGGQKDIWNVVVEYFHFFRFGVPITLPLGSADERQVKMDSAENAETKQQRAFLRSSMTDDVILGERRGVEALMDQWRGYSSSFRNLYLQLKRIERTSDQFVSVSATLSVTVSDTTIRDVFPHLQDGNRALRSKLLGQRLVLPCSLCFEWDAARGRVVRLETTVNFMTPLMKALGDLSDVASVLQHARITRDGAVGIQDS